MNRWYRPLLALGLCLLLTATAGLAPASPFWPGKLVSGPDLKDFRTVDTAVTVRISKAAPAVPRQPAFVGISFESEARPVVALVQPGSPAADAGVQPGDTIQAVEGKPVATVALFREVLGSHGPDDVLELTLSRGGKPMPAKITLGATSRPLVSTSDRPGDLGVSVEAADGTGARLRGISKDEAAEKAGLKVGDVLLKINNVALTGPDKLPTVLGEHKAGEEVTLLVLRDGKEFEVKTRLGGQTNERRGSGGWDNRQAGMFRQPVYRLAVVCVEYPDVKHNPKIASKDWETALFSKGAYKDKSVTGQQVYGSLNDYYQELSCGAFHVEGKVFDYVEVGRKRAEYGTDSNRTALLGEALDKLYSRDGKEVLKGFDGVFFLYAGDRVPTSRGSLYWPHRASFNHQGKRWSYFICPEGGERMGNTSVICHEFGHMLGLPDLYTRPEAPEFEGVGVWCAMANQAGNGRPQHFSAWCKEQLGWITPTVIDPTMRQKLILNPVEGSSKECFKVLLRPDGSEYLLLENRTQKGFDASLPGEGLLIWYVSDGKLTIEVAHGSTGPGGPGRFLGSVPYPSKANNAFTPLTTPSSRSPRPGAYPIHITNIQKLPDGRITFYIGYEYL
jgi:M6 family metalloprotease-like protein